MRDEELRQIIRKNLTALRVAKGISQEQVGQIVGKSTHAVGSWEQGLSLPDICTLYQLAKYYGRPIEYMFQNNEIEG